MLGQLLAKLGDGRVKIDRRRVLKPADLLADLRHDRGMTVADRDRDNPGERIKVLLASLVPDVLHVPLGDQEGLAIIRDQARCEILPAHGQHFIATGRRTGPECASRSAVSLAPRQPSGSRRTWA